METALRRLNWNPQRKLSVMPGGHRNHTNVAHLPVECIPRKNDSRADPSAN